MALSDRRRTCAAVWCTLFVGLLLVSSAGGLESNDNDDSNNLGLLTAACADNFCRTGVSGLDLWLSLEEVSFSEAFRFCAILLADTPLARDEVDPPRPAARKRSRGCVIPLSGEMCRVLLTTFVATPLFGFPVLGITLHGSPFFFKSLWGRCLVYTSFLYMISLECPNFLRVLFSQARF